MNLQLSIPLYQTRSHSVVLRTTILAHPTSILIISVASCWSTQKYPTSLVTLLNSPNGFFSLSCAVFAPGPGDTPGNSGVVPCNSFGVNIPGVPGLVTEGEPACAWITSPSKSPLRSKSTDLESRIVRKLIASMPLDSAGMIWAVSQLRRKCQETRAHRRRHVPQQTPVDRGKPPVLLDLAGARV